MQGNYCTATTKYLTVLIYTAECEQRYLSHRKKIQGKDVSNRWKCKRTPPALFYNQRDSNLKEGKIKMPKKIMGL
jgi:hypothetical protein